MEQKLIFTREAEAKTQKISVPKSDFLLLNAGRRCGQIGMWNDRGH